MHRYFNGLKTAALLGLLTGLILAVGWFFGGSTEIGRASCRERV